MRASPETLLQVIEANKGVVFKGNTVANCIELGSDPYSGCSTIDTMIARRCLNTAHDGLQIELTGFDNALDNTHEFLKETLDRRFYQEQLEPDMASKYEHVSNLSKGSWITDMSYGLIQTLIAKTHSLSLH